MAVNWDKIDLHPEGFPKTKAGYTDWSLHDRVEDELTELCRLIEYRPGMIAEGLDQRANVEDHFRGIITYGRITHPNTSRLIALAQEAATASVMRFKREFARPRPSQMCPALMPPVDPPEHGAFPSGHATQSYTIAQVLNALMPHVAATHWVKDSSGVRRKEQRNPWIEMAERISRGREVMGLHYPSDSAAGRKLAEHHIFPTLQAMPELATTWDGAKKEWSV